MIHFSIVTYLFGVLKKLIVAIIIKYLELKGN